MGKKSKKEKKEKTRREEVDEEAAGPGGRAEEDPVFALSKLLDDEYNAGPWPAVQLQKGDDGYKFGTRFKQQRYKVSIVPYQSPKFMLAFGVLVGAFFISFGAVTLEDAEGLRVVRKVYDCNFPGSEEACACDGMASCTTPLEVPQDMGGDLILYYELEGFKQNHRRYKPSFAPQHGQTPPSAVPHIGSCAPGVPGASGQLDTPRVEGGPLGAPATAAGARASRLQSWRFHRLRPSRRCRSCDMGTLASRSPRGTTSRIVCRARSFTPTSRSASRLSSTTGTLSARASLTCRVACTRAGCTTTTYAYSTPLAVR